MTTQVAEILDGKQEVAQTTESAPLPEAAQKPDDRVSSKMDTLLRREQAALARERQAKQREEEAEKRWREIEERSKKIEDFESVKTKNSKRALDLLGMDYNQLTESVLKEGEIPPEVQIKRIEERFESYKTEQEKQREQQSLSAQKAADEQAQKVIDSFKQEINTYLGDNSSRYEFIKFEGQESLVYDVIDEHYRRTTDSESGVGKILSITEAADKVEEYLEKKYNDAKKLNKFQTLLGAVPAGTIRDAAQAQNRNQPSPKTLTNQLSAQAPTKPLNRPLTDEERVQKAIAHFRSLRPGV